MRILTHLFALVQEFITIGIYPLLYARRGTCMRCGRCCRHVYIRTRGRVISTFKEYAQLLKRHSFFTHFAARGHDEAGHLYFACDLIGQDNRCAEYTVRPFLCRSYPHISMIAYGAVPKEHCGFYFVNRLTGKKIT